MIKVRPAVWLVQDDFGTYVDKSGEIKKVNRFTWSNYGNVSLQVS